MIGRLGIERTRHMGNRDDRRNLGTVIPHEILFKKARLPTATNGRVGISAPFAKNCLKERKTIGIAPANVTKVISVDSFDFSSE